MTDKDRPLGSDTLRTLGCLQHGSIVPCRPKPSSSAGESPTSAPAGAGRRLTPMDRKTALELLPRRQALRAEPGSPRRAAAGGAAPRAPALSAAEGRRLAWPAPEDFSAPRSCPSTPDFCAVAYRLVGASDATVCAMRAALVVRCAAAKLLTHAELDGNLPMVVEFFKWWVVDERTGDRWLTTYKLSRPDAQRAFPCAEPEPLTRDVRHFLGCKRGGPEQQAGSEVVLAYRAADRRRRRSFRPPAASPRGRRPPL